MTYRFGLYTFDPVTGALRREGVHVPLEPQPARALAALLAQTGAVVTREELRLAIWGAETHVDFDRGLAYVLSQIRAALQDTAANPRFVQTVPRQGCKFIAPVSVVAAAEEQLATQPSWWTRRRQLAIAGASALAITSGGVAAALLLGRKVRIGVSIFDNESGEPEWDPWVHAVSDAVVASLTSLAPDRLAIIGNAAPLRRPRNIRNLKSLANEIEADYVLLGQLQKQGADVRFVTHVIRLPAQTHLQARRVSWTSPVDWAAFEQAVVDEYARAVRAHVLGS